MEKQRLLYWDVESSTTQFLIENYGTRFYSKYLNHKNITRYSNIFGAAWQWIDEGTPVKCISVKHTDPTNDYGVILKLHQVLSQADILIGHNSDKFDYKKFNARALYHDLPPIMPKKSIDTIKLARKYFGLDCGNSLDAIAKFLKLEQLKMRAPDWSKVLEGDEDEIRYMRAYNKGDIVTGIGVFKKLNKWNTSSPAIYSPTRDSDNKIVKEVCPYCASPNIKKEGFRMSNTGKFKHQWHACKDCNKFFKGERINL